jgi:hypothetical protein
LHLEVSARIDVRAATHHAGTIQCVGA